MASKRKYLEGILPLRKLGVDCHDSQKLRVEMSTVTSGTEATSS